MKIILSPTAGEENFSIAVSTDGNCWTADILPAGQTADFIASHAEDDFITFDLKNILRTFPVLSIGNLERWSDLQLAAYLDDPTRPCHTPEDCFKACFPEEELPEHAWQILEKLCKYLQETMDGNELFRSIEMPLIPVVAAMEERGILLDEKALKEFGSELSGQIGALEKEICELCDCQFNINSTKQLNQVLFEKLALTPAGKKTRSGYSTDAESLEKLRDQHPVIDRLLRYRKLSKLNSTYVEGLLKYQQADGKIHTVFNLTATATGRLSSSEPNLQNLPAGNKAGGVIRKFFQAPEGFVFLDADYSQIELRILAHMANDPVMLEAFCHNEDIHAVTAAQIFNVAAAEVTPEMRRRAKAVNFGIIYGMSAFALANDLNISQAEAKTYIKSYFEKYSAVRKFLDETLEKAKHNGYVETLFKRRRPLPELKSKVFAVRSFGERAALNAPIQGTAADLIKLAMIKVNELLQKNNIPGGLLLQIHDELLLTVPENRQTEAAELLRSAMENALTLAVPLKVSLSCGKSYFDVK